MTGLEAAVASGEGHGRRRWGGREHPDRDRGGEREGRVGWLSCGGRGSVCVG